MQTWTLIYLLVCISIYALFGGADFGGGILEMSLKKHPKLQNKLSSVLAPIWEANHVWLIAIIVILFVGLPKAYSGVMTQSFYPISIALLGIVLRGTFFTLQKYDPEPGALLGLYKFLFRFSSLVAPLGYGMVVANMITPYEMRLNTWGHLSFQLMIGLFVASLFTYLATLLFMGENHTTQDLKTLKNRAIVFFLSTFFMGGLVLIWGNLSQRVELQKAMEPIQIGMQVIALVSIYFIWRGVQSQHPWRIRFFAGVQLLSILGGWFYSQYPVIIHNAEGPIYLEQTFSPDIVLFNLNIGLSVVLILVLPALFYLFKIFNQGR